MATTCDYNVFVGAETGLLKGIDLEKKLYKNVNDISTLERQNEICVMCWGNEEETEICLGLRNQTVLRYDTTSGSLSEQDVRGGEGSLKGLNIYNGSLLTCTSSGLVKLWNDDDDDAKEVEFEVGNDICRMRQNSEVPNLIATGGKENDLKIWDLNSPEEPTFKAKNVPHDFLNLRVPVWVLDMHFFPNSEKIVACTGYHQVRVYDPSTPQRRPVINMECGEHPLMSLSLCNNENQVVVGNSQGYMHLLDLRKKALVYSFKGFAGSIRCIQCHPTLPIVASCGLDRFLRVHDFYSRKLLHKVYLKSRLNWLLLKSNFTSSQTQDAIDENMDDEVDLVDDELWKDMEVTGETTKRKQELITKSKKLKSSH